MGDPQLPVAVPLITKRWSWVRAGLSLKLYAVWILLPLPLFLIFIRSYPKPVAVLVGGTLLLALLTDAVGRSLCLAVGNVSRGPLLASVLIQASALLAALVFLIGLWEFPQLGLFFALSILLSSQVVVALLFTEFLRKLALWLNRLDLAELANKLRLSVVSQLISLTGLAVTALFVGTVTAILSLFLYWVGALVGLALSTLALLPLLLLWLWAASSMFGRYAVLLSQLRREIQAGLPNDALPPASPKPE